MRILRIVPVVLLAFAIGACDDSTTFGDDSGTLSLMLTDAPGDFLHAYVTIDRIELMAEEGDSAGEGEGEEAGGRVVLRSDAFTTDLLTLSNDVAELVDEAVVPGGSYEQLRFVISGGCIEVEGENGETMVYASSGYTECGAADGALQMPSLGQSGLKVNLPAGFRVAGDQNIVLVDFDVAQSFGHQAGNSGKWVMHPVIHATEIAVTGGIDVSVTLADSVELPDSLTVDDLLVRLGEEPAVELVEGAASLLFLAPATYSVDLVTPDSVVLITVPELPTDVTVGSGADATLEIEIVGVE